MKNVRSKYKILGGFGLLIVLNFLMGILTLKLIFNSKVEVLSFDQIFISGDIIVYGIIFGLQILLLVLFWTQNKFIISEFNQITYVNPLLPFIKTTKTWDTYDYWVTVDESSRGGTYEALWLIKNNRIEDRFSSFYYSNYSKLKRNVEGKVKGKGPLRVGPIRQLAMLFGMKIK